MMEIKPSLSEMLGLGRGIQFVERPEREVCRRRDAVSMSTLPRSRHLAPRQFACGVGPAVTKRSPTNFGSFDYPAQRMSNPPPYQANTA